MGSKNVIIVLFIFLTLSARGQEEEYYKIPEKRTKNHEVINLPNLDSKFSTLYFGLAGAFRKPYSTASGDFSDFGEYKNSLNDWIEIILGLNLNNNVFIETGAVRLINELDVFAYPTLYNQWGFSVANRYRQFYVPLNAKKKVFSLNRVTNNAYLNVGVGMGFLVGNKPSFEELTVGNLQENLRSPYLENFYVTLYKSKSPIYIEFGTEIKGNVTERLELLVFVKGIIRKNKYLSNSFDIEYAGGGGNRYYVYENPVSLVFGLQARFNSKKFYRYSSRI